MSSLRAQDVVFSYGDRVVFDGLSLTAGHGQRLGLVGENGAGKSTLLRLLAGLAQPRAGTRSTVDPKSVSWTRNCRTPARHASSK